MKRTLLTRPSPTSNPMIRSSSERRAFSIKAPVLTLSGLNLSVLRVLLEHAPETLSHEDLALTVWEREFVSEVTIAKRISLLRDALNQLSGAGEMIKTYPHKRYGIAVEVVPQTFRPEIVRRLTIPVNAGLTVGIVLVVALGALAVLSGSETGDRPRLVHPETGATLIPPD